MIRRSTSLAVCWAPIRMMPSERPRSATSSRISLIGRGALPRRVLVQLVEHDEQQRPRGARPPPCARTPAAATTPTTKRLARSCRLCRSTTVTCWLVGRCECALGRRAMSAADQRAEVALAATTQPADERVDGADADRAARPSRSRVVLVGDPRRRRSRRARRTCAAASPSMLHAPSSPAGVPRRASWAATWCTTIVYCWRSSSASANRNGSSSLAAELLDRPVEASTPRRCGRSRRAGRSGRRAGAARRRRRARTARPAGRAARSARASLVVEPGVRRGRGTAGPRP